MNKTVTFVGTLAFTLAIGFSPLSLVHAQKNKTFVSSKLSSNDLPKISITSSMGVFYSDFSAQNISKTQLVSQLSEWLGGKDEDTFKLVKSWNDEIGIEKTMFQHYYNGIKVQDDIIIIHEKDGKVVSVNGEFIKVDNVTIQSPISSQEIKNIIAIDNRTTSENITMSPIENVISKKEFSGKLHIGNSAMVTVYSSVKPIFSKVYFINNVTKEIFNSNTLMNSDFIGHTESNSKQQEYNCNINLIPQKSQFSPLLDTSGTSATYYKGNQSVVVDSYNGAYRLKHNVRKVWTMDAANWGTATNGWGITSDGYVVRTSGTAPNQTAYIVEYTNSSANYTSTATKPAVEVHWSIQKSNDYYSNIHNRNNFDGNGTPIACYYNLDFNVIDPTIGGYYGANATALPLSGGGTTYYAMAFGNGQGTSLSLNPFVGIDVGGHEYSHLVVSTNGTGGLTYQGESGALNEAFADMLGASIEFYSAPSQANWTIGEGLINASPNFLRSMSNPETSPPNLNGGAPQPNTYQGANWASTAAGSIDNGGVHINSGVGNKWFYLLSVGGIHNNKTVVGLTIQKAEKIAYKTLTGGYLTPNSNFLAAYNASKQAAIALYGAGSNELQQVENAWCAVGVGNCANLLSVNDLNNFDQENIKIYPSPVINGQFTIESNIKDDVSFKIYDVSGKLIKQKEKLNKGINKVQTNGITKGMYIIKIDSKGQIISKKVLFN